MNARLAENHNQDLELADLCRPIAEASPVPMAGVEGASRIVRYVNPAFCLLVGKLQEELIGNRFSGVVPAGEELLSLVDRVYRTGQAESHIGQEHSTDHPFYWSYVIWPVLAADGLSVGIVIQVTETTPFHRQAAAMNQALMIGSVRQHELTETAERLNTQLLRANSDLKQFAFAASHDLQEPLRTLTNYSQLLLKRYPGQLDDDASLYVDFIRTAARRMQELLAALLAYTRSGEDEEAEPSSPSISI